MNAYVETGFQVPISLMNEFHRQYPSVKWKIRQDAFAVITQNAPLVLSGPNAPDIMRLPQVSGLVKDHLLKNLDGYFKAYGWNRFPASQLSQVRMPSSGHPRGAGSLWAFGLNYSLTGVFYNKTLAAKIGMTTPPTTLAQFDALLAKAKAGGVTPIVQFNGGATGGLLFPLQQLMAIYGATDADQQLDLPEARSEHRHGRPTSPQRSTCSSGSRPATSTATPTPPTTRR